jgi:molecular chaperone DnaK
MIERNTTIPTKKTHIFSTYADNQTAVDIQILQGERPMAHDNKLLGNFRLDGIPMARRGDPKIEVTFDIDANGILHVTAKDVASGKDQKITITGTSGLSEAEVEHLRKEAEKFAQEDKKTKDKIETRNRLDSLVYASEKQLQEFGSKIPAEIKSEIETKLADAKKVLENKESLAEDLSSAETELSTIIQKLGQHLYSSSGPSPEPMATEEKKDSHHSKKQESVVDADFEVVDDNK